jgi:hypothetical protein
MINREVIKYEKEFEDYSDGYDITQPQESIESEITKMLKVVSPLKNRTLYFSINQQKTDKEAFGAEGIVFKRTAIISKESSVVDLRELGMLEGTLMLLGYHKANN